jgi:hypothetical protein
MRRPLPPALLRDHDVPVGAQAGELVLERSHLGSDRRDPPLELFVGEPCQVV